jgi:hypothetical protein
LFRLINEEGVWQTILRNKYLKNRTITQVQHQLGDSHFWFELMKAKEDILRMGWFKLGDGTQIHFWEDKWLGNFALKDQYPNLFNIVQNKHVTLATVFRSTPLNVSFHRPLVDNNLLAWQHLVTRVMNIQLMTHRDTFVWPMNQHGKFIVRSMYRALTDPQVVPAHHPVWKLKIPLKIKIFI